MLLDKYPLTSNELKEIIIIHRSISTNESMNIIFSPSLFRTYRKVYSQSQTKTNKKIMFSQFIFRTHNNAYFQSLIRTNKKAR